MYQIYTVRRKNAIEFFRKSHIVLNFRCKTDFIIQIILLRNKSEVNLDTNVSILNLILVAI